jgi:hypothetical protein
MENGAGLNVAPANFLHAWEATGVNYNDISTPPRRVSRQPPSLLWPCISLAADALDAVALDKDVARSP